MLFCCALTLASVLMSMRRPRVAIRSELWAFRASASAAAFSLEDAGGLEHLFLLASPTPLTFAQAEELAAKALRDDREPLRPPPRVCATTAPKLAPPAQLGRWRRLVLQRGTKAPAGLRPVHLVIFHR